MQNLLIVKERPLDISQFQCNMTNYTLFTKNYFEVILINSLESINILGKTKKKQKYL